MTMTEKLESFAASKKPNRNGVQEFTTAQVAKALKCSVPTAKAILANRSRHGRISSIQSAGEGRWVFVSTKKHKRIVMDEPHQDEDKQAAVLEVQLTQWAQRHLPVFMGPIRELGLILGQAAVKSSAGSSFSDINKWMRASISQKFRASGGRLTNTVLTASKARKR